MSNSGLQIPVAFLKDIGTGTSLLACGECLDAPLCGGLHLQAGTVTSCLDYCTCAEEQRPGCPSVCPRKPRELANRIHEVLSFDLNNLPRTRRLPLPLLPNYVPAVHGRGAGGKSQANDYIALPMSHALTGRGESMRARTARELEIKTGMRPRIGWILSGTEDDRFVERFWASAPVLSKIFGDMKEAGVVFATSPNFSLTNEVPRHDNLHAMKRIAWVWHFMQQAGICTALHINGRTDHDFGRWAEFVRRRPEVRAVAFEFLTGALPDADRDRYIDRLRQFSTLAERKLHLVLRGSKSTAEELRSAFASVTVIDTNAYQTAIHRRQAFLDDLGQVRYEKVATEHRSQVAALFTNNNDIMRMSLDPLDKRIRAAQGRLSFWKSENDRPSELPRQSGTDDKTGQADLFPT